MSEPEVQAPRTIQVEFTDALVEQLGEWSEPLRLKVERTDDGKYILVAERLP